MATMQKGPAKPRPKSFSSTRKRQKTVAATNKPASAKPALEPKTKVKENGIGDRQPPKASTGAKKLRSAPAQAHLSRPTAESPDPGICEIAAQFGLSEQQLVAAAGVEQESPRSAIETSMNKQKRLREMLEIVDRVTEWAGGPLQAMAWYRGQPIASLGDRTPEILVKAGKVSALRDYIDIIALGGFA